MRKRLAPYLYATIWVYTAALSGWSLNGNDDPFSILCNLVILLGVMLVAYGTIQERENQ
ncbi:hypothetical protein [Corynebacterium aurimucosum]